MSSLLRDQKETLQAVAMTLQDACESSSLCQWSPVQLAYLGHLELLEAQESAAFISEAFISPAQGVHLQAELQQIQTLASDLRDSPDQRDVRLNLQKKIYSLVKDFELAETPFNTALTDLSQKIASNRARVQTLASQIASSNPSVRGIKDQIVAAKLHSDLATWHEASVNQQALLKRFEALKNLLIPLRNIATREPTTLNETRDMASEVLVRLEPILGDGGT
jgi:hypothetical protein